MTCAIRRTSVCGVMASVKLAYCFKVFVNRWVSLIWDRQPALCTNNCGQAHDAKRAARAAGLCSKHVGVVVGAGVQVKGGVRFSVVESHCAVFSFTFATLTVSMSSW